MPIQKTQRERSQEAVTLATSFSLVRYNHVTYIPVDYETGDDSVTPPPERTVWKPLDSTAVQRKALAQFDTLFVNPSEEFGFYYMVAQAAHQHLDETHGLLIRTAAGLRELRSDGQLHLPSGQFVPNYVTVILNEDQADKDEVMSVITEWLDSEEEAIALLRHLATILAPGWSAVKYVLLLGDGRNGKSVLMGMLEALFGWENCSHVSRQDISKASPTVTTLLGMLVNIVYDGVAEYLKDSGNEKSLIAGEPVSIRQLYSSVPTMVSTNALFVEGLNREPRSSDKSSALQARITRFWFPNTYKDDLLFKERMHSERMLGALLALLIDNYVRRQDKAVMLAPTSTAVELQMEHMKANSLAVQFVLHVDETDPLYADSLIGLGMDELAAKFQSWRVSEGDISVWSVPDVLEQFRPVVTSERRSRRVNNQPRKLRIITGFKSEMLTQLQLAREEEAHDKSTPMVDE